MSSETDIVRMLADDYPHRDAETVREDVEASRILEGYLQFQNVDDYEFIDSDFHYQAALGRLADSEAEMTVTSHFTYPDGESFSLENIRTEIRVDEADKALEQGVISSPDKLIDASGVNVLEDRKAASPGGNVFTPDTLHCVVFYNLPVVAESDETVLENDMARFVAREALNKPSLATALIHSGRDHSGDYFSGMQIDYWTRTVDGIDDGLDYSSLDWENPGSI